MRIILSFLLFLQNKLGNIYFYRNIQSFTLINNLKIFLKKDERLYHRNNHLFSGYLEM